MENIVVNKILINAQKKEKRIQKIVNKENFQKKQKKISRIHKGKKLSKETKRKISKSRKGIKHSEKTRQKLKEINIGKKLSEKTKKKISESNKGNISPNKGKILSKEIKRKMSEAQKREKSHMFGKHHSKETIKKISESIKKLWKDPNSIYNSKNYQKKLEKSCNVKPNKPEIIILNILDKMFPNEWIYTGDFKVWINGKNPDFVNFNKNKIIEHFGNFYHSEYFTGVKKLEHENNRIIIFNKVGYDTLIIWENELSNMEKLKRKIYNFNLKNLVFLKRSIRRTKCQD